MLDGQAVTGHVFNAASVDGRFGLFAIGGAASFDDVRVKTDDAAFAAPPAPAPLQLALQGSQAVRFDATLTAHQTDPWRLYSIADPSAGQTSSPANPTLTTRQRAARDLALLQTDLRTATTMQYTRKSYKLYTAPGDISSDKGPVALFKAYQETVGEALLLELNRPRLKTVIT
jgi:hypothetical protein